MKVNEILEMLPEARQKFINVNCKEPTVLVVNGETFIRISDWLDKNSDKKSAGM
jgi:hypothetical protein